VRDFTIEVRRDIGADVTILAVRGALTMPAASRLWTALGKCLAECPVCVVVDLRDAILVDPLALTVFRAASLMHRRESPDVALFLCLDRASLDLPAQAALGNVAVVDSVMDALDRAAAMRQVMRRFTADLPNSPEAPSLARSLVLDACRCWSVEHIADPARLVASELVTNACLHAATSSRLEIQLRGQFLHVRVSDGSPSSPLTPDVDVVPASRVDGRGLWLVGRYGAGWGWRPDATGKVVWATIRVSPVPAGCR
jgi:anti-sigma regulatory factor (Ser/Thr protein kinase)